MVDFTKKKSDSVNGDSSQKESKQQEPSTEAGLPVGTRMSVAVDTSELRNLGTSSVTITEFCEVATQTESRDAVIEKVDASTNTSLKFTETGTQTQSVVDEVVDLECLTGHLDYSGGNDNEQWESGDLTEIREFAGYVYGEANTQLCNREVANQMAKKLLNNPEHITSSSIIEVLKLWRFANKYADKECPCGRPRVWKQ